MPNVPLGLVGQRECVHGSRSSLPQCPRRFSQCRARRKNIVDEEHVGALNLRRIRNMKHPADVLSPLGSAHRSRLNTRLS